MVLFGDGPSPSPTVEVSAESAEVKSSDAEAFEFVVSGMREERSKLVSGVCRMQGTFFFQHEEQPEKNLKGPLEAFAAFDKRKVRYDVTRPDFVVDPSTIQSSPESNRVTAERTRGRSTRRFADDGTRVAGWHSDNPLVAISQAKDYTDRRATEYVDIRGITLYDTLSINRGYTLGQVFDRLGSYVKGQVATVDDSTWVLSKTIRSDEQWVTKFSLTVDVASGFTPTSFKCQSAPVNEVDEPDSWVLEWENSTDWSQINGVWVPTHHETSVVSGPFSRVTHQKVLDFYWEFVNEPVDENLFNYTTFEIPDDVAIADFSGGAARGTRQGEGCGASATWVFLANSCTLSTTRFSTEGAKGPGKEV
jgi:hypothetical protein